jgi:hypothetical protein
MEYRVQRPSTVWIETVIEANSFDEALELSEKPFREGDFTELDTTWEIGWDRHWITDETGETEEQY